MTASGDRRRAEQAAMQAQAAEIGRRCELGEPVTQLRRERTRLRQHWGCMTMFFSVLLPLVLSPLLLLAHLRPAVIAVLIVAGFALGVAVYASEGPVRVDWVLAYDGGLAQLISGEQAPRVIPWGLADAAVHRFVVPAYGGHDPYLARLRVTGLDGTEITVGDGYPQDDVDRLGDQVDLMLARTRLPAAVDQVLSGLPAQFGDLVISAAGIRWRDSRGRDREALFRDLSSIRLSRQEIRLARPGLKPVRAISVSDLPDSYVALLLLQELSDRVPVRLDGERLALPGPVSRASVPAARARLLLSEQDVSEILGRPVRMTGGAAQQGFRGEGVTLSLMVLGTGKIGQLNLNAGRKHGRPVPGVGDSAWLRGSDRAIVVALPTATFKMIIHGLPEASRAAALVPLARIVAGRIAEADAGRL